MEAGGILLQHGGRHILNLKLEVFACIWEYKLRLRMGIEILADLYDIRAWRQASASSEYLIEVVRTLLIEIALRCDR